MIRGYVDADLEAVLDVWYEASLVAHSFLSEDFFARERSQVADVWLPMADTTVYESDGRVVGFVALVGNEVGAIFVHPNEHGRGIGRALMDRARSMRPYLELDVFEDNAIGRAFYDAFGFTEIARHAHDATGFTQIRLRTS